MRELQSPGRVLFALLLTISGNFFSTGSGHCIAGPLRTPHFRTVSGYILTQQNERLPGVTVVVRGSFWNTSTISDREGCFRLDVPVGSITIRLKGKNIQPLEKAIERTESSENLEFKVNVVIAPIQESVVIQDTTLNPTIDQRNDTIYQNTLFERDDQLVEGLNAGINAGQHEGGGKSLEIRRFGFNLDHDGVNGGLKILVDDVQQNQGSQGHGQGYLGQLKSLRDFTYRRTLRQVCYLPETQKSGPQLSASTRRSTRRFAGRCA